MTSTKKCWDLHPTQFQIWVLMLTGHELTDLKNSEPEALGRSLQAYCRDLSESSLHYYILYSTYLKVSIELHENWHETHCTKQKTTYSTHSDTREPPIHGGTGFCVEKRQLQTLYIQFLKLHGVYSVYTIIRIYRLFTSSYEPENKFWKGRRQNSTEKISIGHTIYWFRFGIA